MSSADERFFALHGDDDDPLGHLQFLRLGNYRKLLKQLEMSGPKGSILDVGCASGQFLQVANAEGWSAAGIEPKERMVRSALSKGLKVCHGHFPDALMADAKFQAIFFNDVLEHIELAGEILAACKEHLEKDGQIVLSLPDSHGLFFRIAVVARHLGFVGPYDRLWQRMFYTPHLHYFSRRSVMRMAERCGLVPATSPLPLPTLTVRGLWQRIRSDTNMSLAASLIQYLAALMLAPFSVLAPDAMAVFLRVDDRG